MGTIGGPWRLLEAIVGVPRLLWAGSVWKIGYRRNATHTIFFKDPKYPNLRQNMALPLLQDRNDGFGYVSGYLGPGTKAPANLCGQPKGYGSHVDGH